jgi:ABC-type Fe3+-siderophore transport system permease subunit
LGETYAASIGVRVTIGRRAVLTIAIGLAGTITTCCGPITFVDFIAAGRN